MADKIYPGSMDEAIPDPKRVADVRKELESKGVKYLLINWIDLLGQPKTKPTPVAELEEWCAGRGPQFAVHSVSMVPERGPADPDQIVIPDLESVIVCPWDKMCAWIFGDLYLENAPYEVCPRLALKRQVQEAADSGFRFMAGLEPEFIVMKYDEFGQPVKAFDNDPHPSTGGVRPARQAWGYDTEASIDSLPFMRDVIEILIELDWDLHDTVAEGAYSQFELDFGYADLVVSADRLTLLRMILKEVAKKHGMFVTFMPKPTQGDWRNAAHINFSAQPVDKPGTNLFGKRDGPWDDVTWNAVAGIMKHGEALTALTCPTVTSYKGFIGRARGFEGGVLTWAPTHVSYGMNNRSSMLRIPQNRKAIENRACDMTMNFYFGLAMTAACVREGMLEKLQPPGPPANETIYDIPEKRWKKAGIRPLPATLKEAIEAFDQDPLAKHVLGPTMHDCYSRYKHGEWGTFHEHITEWEVKEYLRFF
jgi:glutamine synthetase